MGGETERVGGFVCGDADDRSCWNLSVFYGVVVYVVGSHDACGYDDGVGVCGVGSYLGCFCRGWRCRRGWFVRHRVVGVLLFQFVNLAPHP